MTWILIHRNKCFQNTSKQTFKQQFQNPPSPSQLPLACLSLFSSPCFCVSKIRCKGGNAVCGFLFPKGREATEREQSWRKWQGGKGARTVSRNCLLLPRPFLVFSSFLCILQKDPVQRRKWKWERKQIYIYIYIYIYVWRFRIEMKSGFEPR